MVEAINGSCRGFRAGRSNAIIKQIAEASPNHSWPDPQQHCPHRPAASSSQLGARPPNIASALEQVPDIVDEIALVDGNSDEVGERGGVDVTAGGGAHDQ